MPVARSRAMLSGMATVRAGKRAAGDRLGTRAFLLLTTAELAYFTAGGIAVYALPLFVTGTLSGEEAGAGIAFGVFAVTALLLRPFAGRLADSWGRRPLLIWGAVLCALSMVLTAHSGTLGAVVVLRLLLGVGEAAFLVAAIAAVADIAPPGRIGEAMSLNSLGLYLGLAFGPPLGQFLVDTSGFTVAWYVAGALAGTAALTAAAITETRGPRDHAASRPPLIHWPTMPLALGFLTSMIAIGGFLAFAALHAEEVGVANPSAPLVAYGCTVVVLRIAFAKVPDRFPPLPLGSAALAVIAVGLTVMALSGTPAAAVGGAALLGAGVAFSTPAFFAAIFANATPANRGAAAGTAAASLDLGVGGGPIVLGFVAQSFGIPWAFGAAAAVAAVGGGWTIWLARTQAPRARRFLV